MPLNENLKETVQSTQDDKMKIFLPLSELNFYFSQSIICDDIQKNIQYIFCFLWLKSGLLYKITLIRINNFSQGLTDNPCKLILIYDINHAVCGKKE